MIDHDSIIIRWSSEDEGFVARVPEFPNLYAFGESQEEARMEAFFVLGVYMEFYEQEGTPLPEPETWEKVEAE